MKERRPMPRILTDSIRTCFDVTIVACVAFAVMALAGCATRKDALLPHGKETMLQLWNQYAGPADGTLTRARAALRRPLTGQEAATALIRGAAYTRTSENEINRQFKRLPDPDLVMYVFPHLAGLDPVPVPGYCTVFPFYQRIHYAMPGERTREY